MNYKYAAYTNVTIANGKVDFAVGAGDEEPIGLIAYSNNLSRLQSYAKKETKLEDDELTLVWRDDYNGMFLDNLQGQVVSTLICIDNTQDDYEFIGTVIVKDPEHITVV